MTTEGSLCECCGAQADDVEGCLDRDDPDVYVMLCGECRAVLSVETL